MRRDQPPRTEHRGPRTVHRAPQTAGTMLARAVAAAATGLLLLVGYVGTPGAQGGQLVPAAASSLVLRPDHYYGQRVTVTATVEQLISPTVFSIDQDRTRSTGQEVLVVAPTLTGHPEVNTYVTVIGEAVPFDPADIARRFKDYTLDVPPDVVSRFMGRPAVLATVVLDAKLEDLAKVPLSPLTPEEEAFDQVMKEVSAAFPAIRGAVDTANPDVTEENVAILREAFTRAETFFAGRKTEDAVEIAREAQKLVQSISEAAAASRWGDAATSVGSLNQLCQRCHSAHRERMDDGSYRVRKGDR